MKFRQALSLYQVSTILMTNKNIYLRMMLLMNRAFIGLNKTHVTSMSHYKYIYIIKHQISLEQMDIQSVMTLSMRSYIVCNNHSWLGNNLIKQ